MFGSRSARTAMTAGAFLTLVSCGGGGGGDATSGAGGPPTPETTLDGDLVLFGHHVHQDQLYNRVMPRYMAFYWTVRNTSSRTVTYQWRIHRVGGGRDDLTGTATVDAHFAGGDGHTVAIEYDEADAGRHTYTLAIDPADRLHETNEANNAATYEIDVATIASPRNPADDLHVFSRELHVHGGLGGLVHDFHYQLENTFDEAKRATWRLRNDALGIDERITVNVPANSHVDTSRTVDLAGAAPGGVYDFHVIIDPDDEIAESDEGDNDHVLHVVIPGSGG
jgi:hypothetical protein